MRNIFKTGLLSVFAILLITACEPQDKTDYELGKAPSEEDLSFTMNATGGSSNIIEFVNTSSVPGVAVWDFGNGSKGKGDVVVSEYPFEGSYEVSLRLATTGGAATLVKNLVLDSDDLSLLEHPLYSALTGGPDAVNGKTWVIDQYSPGALGIGPSDAFTPSWWQDGPNGKAGSSYYEQKYTFKQVGVELIWENNGFVYTNGSGVTGLAAEGYTNAIPNPDVGDFDVEFQPKSKYNFSLNTSDSTLTLTDGAFLGFYAGTSTFKILEISEERMYIRVHSAVEPGNAWYMKFVIEELNVEPEVPELPLKATPLSEDFENTDFDVEFAFEDMGDFTNPSYQNPAPVGINTSSKVFLYEKKAGTFYSNIAFVADDYKFDLSEQNQITLKVFIPSYNDYTTTNNVAGEWVANKLLQASIAVKLQNDDLGGSAWETQTEILKTGLEKDKWIELTFDFSNVASREDYNKILIQFGTEGHDGGGVFFFDDFEFHK